MTENNNHKDALKALYSDLQRIEPNDHATREVVTNAIEHLERAISDEIGEGIGEGSEDHSGLIDQLNEAAMHLETDHPAVAAAIRTAINILTQLGL